MFLHNREELQNLRKEAEKRLHAAKLRVLVCAAAPAGAVVETYCALT